ncbi:spermatogenesis associated 2-like [Callorhinchus milii]|uniref:Spermatogenesis-associated protein 2 PUB-like domain-containing protein n=1 Tax=Callorhinchus milii TaxID=7868 RepID=A0A4W3JIW6_CALMI|nr:spermatogenesis associated 2-like [Callorhinchus milii]|eukprot:gi/632944363/ref/XP_007887468.1/ PREDICTED: spermatogenesis-associated protein 2-like protein [Callorhinchus milii]
MNSSLQNTCEQLRQSYEDCLPGPGGICNDDEVKRLTRLHLTQNSEECHDVLRNDVFEIVANSLRGKRDLASALKLLIRAFELLELAAVNLAVFPWRKEFKTIKTFSGAYVHYLKPALCSEDLASIFKKMGYRLKDGFHLELRDSEPRESVKRAFEFFSARLECEILLEIVEKGEHCVFSVNDLIQERILMESIDKCVNELSFKRAHSLREAQFGRGESTEEFENLYTDIKLNGNESVLPSHREDSRNANRQNATTPQLSDSVIYNGLYRKQGNKLNFAASRNHLGCESPEAPFKDGFPFDSVHSNQGTNANVNAEDVLSRSKYVGDERYQQHNHISNINSAQYGRETCDTAQGALCDPVTRYSQDHSFRSIPDESSYSRSPEAPTRESRQPSVAICEFRKADKVDEYCEICKRQPVYFQCECSMLVCNYCGYQNRMECTICDQSLKKLENSQRITF